MKNQISINKLGAYRDRYQVVLSDARGCVISMKTCKGHESAVRFAQTLGLSY